jgi:hypothetical protein
VIARACEVDLHPDRVSNTEMGAIFEELIRRFAEASNEKAGEHFTPREVVRLMVNLLLDGDEEVLGEAGAIRAGVRPQRTPARPGLGGRRRDARAGGRANACSSPG